MAKHLGRGRYLFLKLAWALLERRKGQPREAAIWRPQGVPGQGVEGGSESPKVLGHTRFNSWTVLPRTGVHTLDSHLGNSHRQTTLRRGLWTRICAGPPGRKGIWPAVLHSTGGQHLFRPGASPKRRAHKHFLTRGTSPPHFKGGQNSAANNHTPRVCTRGRHPY